MKERSPKVNLLVEASVDIWSDSVRDAEQTDAASLRENAIVFPAAVMAWIQPVSEYHEIAKRAVASTQKFAQELGDTSAMRLRNSDIEMLRRAALIDIEGVRKIAVKCKPSQMATDAVSRL